MKYSVEREARLLVAGEYPDKQIALSEEDLDHLVRGFERVPVKIEHRDSPMQPGFLTETWRKGKELWGKIALTAASWGFIEENGARKVSLSLNRSPLSIGELSIVRHPRVENAVIFSEENGPVWFTGELLAPGRPVEETLARLKAEGKLVPASESFARDLLAMDEARFSEEAPTPAHLFRRFLEAQPAVIAFSETAPAAPGGAASHPPEEARFAHLLGTTMESVEKYREQG